MGGRKSCITPDNKTIDRTHKKDRHCWVREYVRTNFILFTIEFTPRKVGLVDSRRINVYHITAWIHAEIPRQEEVHNKTTCRSLKFKKVPWKAEDVWALIKAILEWSRYSMVQLASLWRSNGLDKSFAKR